MHTLCPNCNQTCFPMIDTSTLKDKNVDSDTTAICDHCRQPVKLTQFAIKSLHSMKRFYTPKPAKAYQYLCKTCNAFTDAEFGEDKSQALCTECHQPHELTPFMLTALKLARGIPTVDETEQQKKLERARQKLAEEQKKASESEETQEQQEESQEQQTQQEEPSESADQEQSSPDDVINLDEEID